MTQPAGRQATGRRYPRMIQAEIGGGAAGVVDHADDLQQRQVEIDIMADHARHMAQHRLAARRSVGMTPVICCPSPVPDRP